MNNKETVIKLNNISKCYRIGLQELHDNISSAVFDWIKSPISNYRKHRSLYRFDDISTKLDNSTDTDPADIIWALRNVSFEVKRGEAVGIIGKNGVGKSTLLKILSRITHPSTGWCQTVGRISSLLEVGTGFHPELTGRENVFLNGTILGMRKKEVKRKFDDIVDFSGVAKFIDTPVKRYSSGMKIRLAFAVAAHLEPEILLVDEVLAVGDAAFQKKCLSKMQEVGEKGRTVIFVSHNMSAIQRLCERTILLDGGQLAMDGPSHKVVGQYLQSELSAAGFREWSDLEKAPGNEFVRLRAVRVRNNEGQITAAVNTHKPVAIEIEYEVLKPGLSLFPHFTLNNEAGLCIFVGLDQDPKWKGRSRPIGQYASTARIPGNLLAEGTLFVGPAMRTIEPDIFHFAEENAVAFEVIEGPPEHSARGDWAKSIPGVIRPLLKWNTTFNPNG